MTRFLCAALAGLLCLVQLTSGLTITSVNLTTPVTIGSPTTMVSTVHSTASSSVSPTTSSAAPPSSTSSTVPRTTSLSPSSTSSPSPSPTRSPIPSSSTAPSPTMTPSPEPVITHDFTLSKNKSGNVTVCARVNVTMQLAIKYINTDGEVANNTFNVNDLFAAVDADSSICSKTDINMMIQFFTTNFTQNSTQNFTQTFTHLIAFNFNTSGDRKSYDLNSVTVQLNASDVNLFPGFDTSIFRDNATDINGTTDRKDLIYSTSVDRSFQCKSNQTFDMTTTPPLANFNGSLELLIYNFQAQAFSFKNDSSGEFDKRVRCSLDQKSSKVVPIAVGAALAGLVIVVLIAYLIGRFRSRKQSSYEALS